MSLCKSRSWIISLAAGAILLSHAGNAFAEPSPEEDNPGGPAVLAEAPHFLPKSRLWHWILWRLVAEIKALKAELEATNTELDLTRTSLAETQETLQLTQDDLNVTNALLVRRTDELDAERRHYRVPQTGQKDCWTANSLNPDDPHFIFPCGLTGHDGDHQAGLAPPANRFVDNGNGTVTDTFTKLVWLIRGDCADELSWPEAVEFATNINGMPNMNACSLRDGSAPGVWRMPNLREMTSLLDYGTPYQTLPDGFPFIGFVGVYWTSTTFALSPNDAPDLALYNACIRPNFYGTGNRDRFNDAYVVNTSTGEVRRSPKENTSDIMKRYKRRGSTPGALDECTKSGFENGSPDSFIPQPKFIAVRNLTINDSGK